MSLDIKNPPSDALAAETEGGLVGASALPRRLGRYSEAHHRTLSMANYIKRNIKNQGFVDVGDLVESLRTCGSYLVFRHYFEVDEMRLSGMTSCNKAMLCPLCAIRRGAKMIQAYMQRLEVIQAESPGLKPYLVTLTVKDGDDLGERFSHLQGALREYNQQRRNAGKGLRRTVEFNKAVGSVGSFEFKRGCGSGLWHPHYHAIWLCDTPPLESRLSAEWKEITGDSFIVNVRPFDDADDYALGFLEVFKYALKFSDMSLADNWEGYLYLNGRRLVNSFGAFRGVEVPESNLDDLLADEPYIEIFYKFLRGVGYSVKSVSKPVQPVQRLFDGAKMSNFKNHLIAVNKRYGNVDNMKAERKRLYIERIKNASLASLLRDEGVTMKGACDVLGKRGKRALSQRGEVNELEIKKAGLCDDKQLALAGIS